MREGKSRAHCAVPDRYMLSLSLQLQPGNDLHLCLVQSHLQKTICREHSPFHSQLYSPAGIFFFPLEVACCSSPWFTLQQLRPNTDQTCWVSFGRSCTGKSSAITAVQNVLQHTRIMLCLLQDIFRKQNISNGLLADVRPNSERGTEKPWKATSRTWPIWFLYHIRSPLCSVWWLQS